MIHYTFVDSPVGKLLLAESDGALERLHFAEGKGPSTIEADWIHDEAPLAIVIGQLKDYFAGRRRDFDYPLSPQGTPFQQTVWRELREIPYGKTISYGELAARIGNPNASRAVGLANGSNPIAIIIPCHRVIGSNGKLTGFGGGLPVKQKLLDLERGSLRLDF